jgi:cell shape-determining protein MreC
VAVFKGGGIASQLTPVSKRFAPGYASSHSLVANAIGYTVSKNLKESKRVVQQTLAPKHDELVKGLNNMVDSQLQQVVEKINKKKELEKQNRDLKQKLQKR